MNHQILRFILVASVIFGTQAPSALAEEPRMNFTTSPLSFALVAPSLSVGFKAGDHFAIGPTLSISPSNTFSNNYYSALGPMIYGIGLQTNYTPNRPIFSDGLVLSGYLKAGIRSTRLATEIAPQFGASVGYQWFYQTGINMAVSAGVNYNSQSYLIFPVGPVFDYRLGYAF
jgi:hypothetical protein